MQDRAPRPTTVGDGRHRSPSLRQSGTAAHPRLRIRPSPHLVAHHRRPPATRDTGRRMPAAAGQRRELVDARETSAPRRTAVSPRPLTILSFPSLGQVRTCCVAPVGASSRWIFTIRNAATCTVLLNAETSVTAAFVAAAGGGGGGAGGLPANPVLAVKVAGGKGTITRNPVAIDCDKVCTASVAPGTFVTLTATPAAGFAFVNWTGACSGAAPTCALNDAGNTRCRRCSASRHAQAQLRDGAGVVAEVAADLRFRPSSLCLSLQ